MELKLPCLIRLVFHEAFTKLIMEQNGLLYYTIVARIRVHCFLKPKKYCLLSKVKITTLWKTKLRKEAENYLLPLSWSWIHKSIVSQIKRATNWEGLTRNEPWHDMFKAASQKEENEKNAKAFQLTLQPLDNLCYFKGKKNQTLR